MSARREFAGEALGTFVIVAAGTSSVALAAITGTLTSAAQVAAAWGAAVFAAILVASRFSRAHLNPAISLAAALLRPRDFPRRRLRLYLCGQMTGAVLGGLAVLAAFAAPLADFERAHGLVRGAPGSERAAMMFGEYFPNPAAPGLEVSALGALLAEAAGTAAMALAAFAAGDAAAARRWPIAVPAACVGATVAAVILVVGPVTQAGLNPARDLGPRLVAWSAGFGSVAIPGPRGGFWVYVAGPVAGAVAAAGLLEAARPLFAVARSRAREGAS